MTLVRRLAVITLTATFAAGCAARLGSSADDDVAAAAAGGSPDEDSSGAESGTAIFDSSVLHSLSVVFDQADYEAMIATYEDTGDKAWIEATVTIDGSTFESVGLRLKGNSSLSGLGGGRREFPEAGTGPVDDTTTDDGGTDVGGGPGRGPGGGATADQPQELPWLIRLDQFVEGQTYQGYEDFVVRSNNSETSLNEAVALELLAQAGLASQQAVAAAFAVNGSRPILRLVVEHPDDDIWYEEQFATSGALYKAESSGDWSYRGDDPASYEEVFDQEGGSDVADLTPLIEFLDFVNNADDETFAAELPDRLDVDAFATYLAMMQLLGNSDDIDGPGNNSYLWWDAESGQFTVVPWDMNLALGGMGGFPGGPPTGEREFPAGGEFPGGEPPADMSPPGADRRGFPGGGMDGRSNPLVERFLERFGDLYEQRLAELEAGLFDNGSAQSILDEWSTMLTNQATALVDAATIATETEAIESALANAGSAERSTDRAG